MKEEKQGGKEEEKKPLPLRPKPNRTLLHPPAHSSNATYSSFHLTNNILMRGQMTF